MADGGATLSADERLQAALGDRYALGRLAGGGGMALVYEARDLKHGRRVAVKVLRPELAAALGPERFLREIELAARLQHPHILPIYDSGGSGALLYYVMPFVEGETLRHRLERERRLPVADALRIGREVAEALAYDHAQGVVHRDVKPANILLYAGHAMVADFGVARALHTTADDQLTQTGMSVGTPAYMSPEQALGAPGVDGRSDQYSLGCMLYEMLAGDLPFSARTPLAALVERTRRPPRRLATIVPAVPESVDRAVLRSLDPDPANRFPAMAAFLDALRDPAPGTGATGSGATNDWSLAVLPFTNLSQDPENEALSDGLSEELIHALARVGGLRVIARTSAFAMKDKRQDVRAIADALQVRAVLDGSVRRAGTRLRVMVQLVDAASGFELWSERYDRELSDVFEVQDDISRAIVATLTQRMFGEPTRVVHPATPYLGAYEAYLQGRFCWNQRSEPSLHNALKHFTTALEIDPSFAGAAAALAECYTSAAIYGAVAASTAMPRAREAAERALGIDPGSGSALAARGSVRALYEHDWAAAERDFLAAVQASPQYPTAHQWYAMNCLVPRRRLDEAAARLARARELDPLSPAIAASSAILRYFAGDAGGALAECRLILGRDPGFGLAYQFIVLALIELGRTREAVEALRHALLLTGGSAEVESALGYAGARAGDEAGAEAALGRLEALASGHYVSPVQRAQVQLALGDTAAALDSLDAAYLERAPEVPLVGLRPVFAPLRGMPRFDALLRRVDAGATVSTA